MTKLTEKDLQLLTKPFEVKWKVLSVYKDKSKPGNYKCICVAYGDPRDTQDRLDEVCGISNRQSKLETVAGKVVCHIGIKVEGEWIWRSGMGDGKDGEDKTSSSGAFKRAGSMFGIGRFIYDIDEKFLGFKGTNKDNPKIGYAVDLKGNMLKTKAALSDYINNVLLKKKSDNKTDWEEITQDQKDLINELYKIIPEYPGVLPKTFDEAADYIEGIKKVFKKGIDSGKYTPPKSFITKVFGEG